jgi:hypothetical protein
LDFSALVEFKILKEAQQCHFIPVVIVTEGKLDLFG